MRLWTLHTPTSNDSAAIVVFNLQDQSQVGAFLAGADHGVSSTASSTFVVPVVPGALGFVSRLPLAGQSATEYGVVFAKGNNVFEVELATVSGDLTMADAQSVAREQASIASGSPIAPETPASTTWGTNKLAYSLGELSVYLIVPILVLRLIQRHRKKSKPRPEPVLNPYPGSIAVAPIPGAAQPKTSGQISIPAGWSPTSTLVLPQLAPLPPPPVRVVPPDWYPDPADPSIFRYFDGHSWTDNTSPRTPSPPAYGIQNLIDEFRC